MCCLVFDNIFRLLVIRFTKDDMLALRKSSKMLSCMSDMLEVVSLTALEPVCYERLEPEDVSSLCLIFLNHILHMTDLLGDAHLEC